MTTFTLKIKTQVHAVSVALLELFTINEYNYVYETDICFIVLKLSDVPFVFLQRYSRELLNYLVYRGV